MEDSMDYGLGGMEYGLRYVNGCEGMLDEMEYGMEWNMIWMESTMAMVNMIQAWQP